MSAQRQSNIAYVPAREQYVPVLRRILPGCNGKELENRCSLLYMRDSATEAMTRCGEDAYPILQSVERLASKYAFAPLPAERIEHVRFLLMKLTATAQGFETVDYELYQIQHPRKEDNAGG